MPIGGRTGGLLGRISLTMGPLRGAAAGSGNGLAVAAQQSAASSSGITTHCHQAYIKPERAPAVLSLNSNPFRVFSDQSF